MALADKYSIDDIDESSFDEETPEEEISSAGEAAAESASLPAAKIALGAVAFALIVGAVGYGLLHNKGTSQQNPNSKQDATEDTDNYALQPYPPPELEKTVTPQSSIVTTTTTYETELHSTHSSKSSKSKTTPTKARGEKAPKATIKSETKKKRKQTNIDRVPANIANIPFISYCMYNSKNKNRLLYLTNTSQEIDCALLVNTDPTASESEFIKFGKELNITNLFWLITLENKHSLEKSIKTVAFNEDLNGAVLYIKSLKAPPTENIAEAIKAFKNHMKLFVLLWIVEFPQWETKINLATLAKAGASPIVVETQNIISKDVTVEKCRNESNSKGKHTHTFDKHLKAVATSFGSAWNTEYADKSMSIRMILCKEKGAPNGVTIPPRTVLGRGFIKCLKETFTYDRKSSDCDLIPTGLVSHVGLAAKNRKPKKLWVETSNFLKIITTIDTEHPPNKQCLDEAYSHFEREDFTTTL